MNTNSKNGAKQNEFKKQRYSKFGRNTKKKNNTEQNQRKILYTKKRTKNQKHHRD